MTKLLYKYPENARILDPNCNHVPFEIAGNKVICAECGGYTCDICGTHFFILAEYEESNE